MHPDLHIPWQVSAVGALFLGLSLLRSDCVFMSVGLFFSHFPLQEFIRGEAAAEWWSTLNKVLVSDQVKMCGWVDRCGCGYVYIHIICTYMHTPLFFT
jgi:hypothetical protein